MRLYILGKTAGDVYTPPKICLHMLNMNGKLSKFRTFGFWDGVWHDRASLIIQQ